MRLLTKRYGYMALIGFFAVTVVWSIESRREPMMPMQVPATDAPAPALQSVPAVSAYLPYRPEFIMHAKNRAVVLFFHASWCPYCRALEQDILATIGQDTSKVLILKVDYDNSSALKKMYGVRTQHTLVTVDADGNKKNFWMGSQTLADIVTKLP